MPCQFLKPLTAQLFLLLAIIISSRSAWSQTQIADWPAGVSPREKLSDKRAYDYDFSDISVQTLQRWIGRVGIELPVKLDGTLSGWVWVQRSETSWFDFGNYRFEGEIRSPELKIEQWTVAAAKVRFGFAEGNWYVGDLSGELKSPIDQARIGIAAANAKIKTATNSSIVINAKIDDVRLKPLFEAFGLAIDVENSSGTLTFNGTVPIPTAADLSTWKSTAQLELKDIALPWIESAGGVSGKANLNAGNWEIERGQIQVARQNLSIAGTGKLSTDMPFELKIDSAQIDASQLLRQLKNDELANQLVGEIQFNALMSGNQLQGIELATATVESQSLAFQSQPFENLIIQGNYTPAGVRLDIKSAELAGGQVSGSALWPDLQSPGQGIPAEVNLSIANLKLEEVTWLTFPVEVRGQATGTLKFAKQKRGNLDDWSSHGQLEIEGLQAAATTLGKADLKWTKESEASQLTGILRLQKDGGLLQSTLVAEMADHPDSMLRGTNLVEYRAEGQVDDYELIAAIGDDESESIRIRPVGSFILNGDPTHWLKQGYATFSQSSLVLNDDRLFRIDLADLSFNENEFRLERFRLLDSVGRVVGAASLRRDNAGEHLIRLRVVDVKLNQYLQSLLPASMRSLEGTAAIDLEIRKNAVDTDLAKDWNGSWQANLSDLTIDSQPFGNLKLVGKLADETVTADAVGTLLGSPTTATFRLPLSVLKGEEPDTQESMNVQVQLERVQVQQLANVFLKNRFEKQLSGNFSAELSADIRSSNDIALTASVEIPLVRQNQLSLVRDLSAQVRYSDRQLNIERLTGGLAEGRIEASGLLNFSDEDVSKIESASINFVAQRLDASSLVAIFYPEYAKYYAGAIDYRGKAIYQRGFRLSGSATAKAGQLFGFPIQVARGNLKTQFAENGSLREVVSNNLHGKGLGGNFEGTLAIRGGSAFSLATRAKVTRGKLDQLGKALGFQQIVGSGTFNGSIDLKSKRIESISAITGGLQIDFEGGDVNSIPLLSSLDRFVPLAQFASMDIENGKLNARIGQGQLRINELVVFSKALTLMASGSAALDGSKLDIDTILQTGGGAQQLITQNAIEVFLVGAAPQLAVVNELNELIRNRSVFLHVGGSAPRPVIQSKTGATAAKAFLQSFGRSTVGISPTANR